MKHVDAPDVGAQDPELENSPIVDYDVEELEYTDYEMERTVCHFNGAPYPLGSYVCSGGELLRCEEGSVWVRKGSCYE